MVTPKQGALVRLLGRNHARQGMEARHTSCREYMEGYKKYKNSVAKPAKTR